MTQYQHDYIKTVYPHILNTWKPYEGNGIRIVKGPDHIAGELCHSFELWIDEAIWMTTGSIDLLDHRVVYDEFYGDILLTGFGLGLGVRLAQLNPRVNSITVVEINPTIVEVGSSQLPSHHNVTVICDDAFTWVPDKKFHCAYHDIFIAPNEVDLTKDLRRKYAPYCKDQYFWGNEYQRVLLQWQ
jgi:hypothetical protein